MDINLSTQEIVAQEPLWFAYLEVVGPFVKTAPNAWQEFWRICGPLLPNLKISSMAGLNHIDNQKSGDNKFVYQAGVLLKEKPGALPKDLELRQACCGKFARFLLTGSYSQLPEAYPTALTILEKEGVSLRDDFFAEIYINTPQDAEEKNLLTEILMPII